MRALAARKITAIAVDMIPRTTVAQMMDVLSSQATAAGYEAVLMAAAALPKFFPMLMTAAGTIAPARVLVLGAGVAGLQAIGTARRLGAVVEAFDVRKAVKEQVESLGAKFVEVEAEDAQTAGGYAKRAQRGVQEKQAEAIARHVAKADVVICTALIPGQRAPILVTGEMVTSMKAGSVIVDLAAEQQGNCELTKPGQTVVEHGVTIIGATRPDQPHVRSRKPDVLAEHGKASLSHHQGRRLEARLQGRDRRRIGHHSRRRDRHARVKELVTPTSDGGRKCRRAQEQRDGSDWLFSLYVFVLATFVGYQVISRVPPLLHTPLMSGTNAISGISLVGVARRRRVGPSRSARSSASSR